METRRHAPTVAEMKAKLPDGAWSPKRLKSSTMRYVKADSDGRDWTTYRLYDTDVLKVADSHTFILDSGGFRTVTTKERMNEYLPEGYSVRQEKGVWWLSRRDGWTTEFYDGISVKDGKQPEPPEESTAVVAKQINKYCKALKELGEGPGFPLPGAGDCLICRFQADTAPHGKVTDTEHLLSHISDEEMYIHGSLILNALRWAGYDNPQFVWNYTDIVVRAVKRYLKYQLGVPG